MAIVTYCLLVTSTGVCTEKFLWDDDYTYTPAAGYSLAPNDDGEVGWTWNGSAWVPETGIYSASTFDPAFDKVTIDGAAGTSRDILYSSSGSGRWLLRVNSTAESGSNAGSNFVIWRFNDAGSSVDQPLTINRATGVTNIAQLTLTTDLALAEGGTGTSLADPNADRIMFWRDSTNKVDWLEVGSGLTLSGTVLSSTSTLTFLATADASSSATLDFTAFNNATYDGYLFVLANVTPATDNVNLLMRTSTNGGTSYDSGASDYLHAAMGYESAGTSRDSSGAGSAIPITRDINNFRVGNAAGEDGVSGTITITGAQLTKQVRVTGQVGYTTVSSAELHTTFSASRSTQADVDAVRFLFSSGNIASGTITMYGYRNA